MGFANLLFFWEKALVGVLRPGMVYLIEEMRSWMFKGTRIATLFVLAVVALPSITAAQQSPRSRMQSNLREVIAFCVAMVRKETDDWARFKLSQFDAFVEPDGLVKWFGSPKERFSFQKCMAEYGNPLKDVTPLQ
jgi:hypothetical protein